MTQKLTPGTAVLLTLAPLLWAGNAVVGRMVYELVPPVTLNFLRWALAFVLLLWWSSFFGHFNRFFNCRLMLESNG